MEAKEIIEIITSILASIGLTICIVAALYVAYSAVTVDREMKQYLKKVDDRLAKPEKKKE